MLHSGGTIGVEDIRKNENYYLKRFKDIQRIKAEYISRRRGDFEQAINEADFHNYAYFKRMSKRVDAGCPIDYLIEHATFSTEKLYEITGDKALLEIGRQESFFISCEVAMHFPQVAKSAKMFTSKSGFLKKHYAELCAEGISGIIHAMHNFDIDSGNKFITYAFHWINFFMNKYVGSVMKENNIRNGTERKYKFSVPVFQSGYRQYIVDLHNSAVDFINEFDGFDFITEKTLASEWNRFLENSSARKRFMRLVSVMPDMSEVLSKPYEPKLVARLAVERLIPSVTKCNMDVVSSIPDYETVEKMHGEESVENDVERHHARLLILKMAHESGLNPDAISSAMDIGEDPNLDEIAIMQLRAAAGNLGISKAEVPLL